MSSALVFTRYPQIESLFDVSATRPEFEQKSAELSHSGHDTFFLCVPHSGPAATHVKDYRDNHDALAVR